MMKIIIRRPPWTCNVSIPLWANQGDDSHWPGSCIFSVDRTMSQSWSKFRCWMPNWGITKMWWNRMFWGR
jgi:hypothetical protein